jgi:hypothetical protein
MLSRDVNFYCDKVTIVVAKIDCLIPCRNSRTALTGRHVGHSTSELDPDCLCRHNRAGRSKLQS